MSHFKKSDHHILDEGRATYAFVIFGAVGDLATKKLYPSLWGLFKKDVLPENFFVVGYFDDKVSSKEDSERNCTSDASMGEQQALYEKFKTLNRFVVGSYDSADDYKRLNRELEAWEKSVVPAAGVNNRIFYLALPAFLFATVATNLKLHCSGQNGFVRVTFEKPFGKDLESARQLNSQIAALLSEEEIYRVEHYAAKEMTKNLLVLRFGNRIFETCWSRQHVASVRLTCVEKIGVGGRGKFFDEYGIVRDMLQGHLIELLCLIAMEKPASMNANDVRDKKSDLLKSVRTLDAADILLGQYVADPNSSDPDRRRGYTDEDSVPNDSRTATFVVAALKISNERWNGVPFILKCGKALNAWKTEIRIQFKDVADNIFDDRAKRNELIVRMQPNESINIKICSKIPGFDFFLDQNRLDLFFGCQYPNVEMPRAYERLLLDLFYGDQSDFIRTDELYEAWRIFTPVLRLLDRTDNAVALLPYRNGSHGPDQHFDFMKRYDYKYYGHGNWFMQSCPEEDDEDSEIPFIPFQCT